MIFLLSVLSMNYHIFFLLTIYGFSPCMIELNVMLKTTSWVFLPLEIYFYHCLMVVLKEQDREVVEITRSRVNNIAKLTNFMI